MLILSSFNKLHIFSLWLRYVFIMYNYCAFFDTFFLKMSDIVNLKKNVSKKNLGFCYGLSSKFVSTITGHNSLSFYKRRTILIYFNSYSMFNELSLNLEQKLFLFSFLFNGFYVNVSFLKNINHFYIFYSNNFVLFFLYVNMYIYFINILISKIFFLINQNIILLSFKLKFEKV